MTIPTGSTAITDPNDPTKQASVGSDGALKVAATFSAASVAINDANTTSNTLAIDSNGKIGISSMPSVTASNPSVGTDGSAIPTSSTLIGASDGVNLQQLTVESSSNRNLRTSLYNGANEASVSAGGALKVDNSAVTQPISAASLPLPSGAATAAKQPALGTAGSASTDVLTVQGIASMTAIKTDGSATTQPISGTVTANAGTGNFTVAQATAASLNATATIQAVTGTSLAADVSNTELRTSIYGKATAAGDTPLLVDSSGRVLIGGGSVAAGATDSGNPIKVGGKYNATLPTLTDGQRGDLQVDAKSIQLVNLAYALSQAIDSITSYPFGHSYTTITTATTTTVKSGSGVIRNIKILGGTLGNVTVYDNTAGSGTTIVPSVTPVQGQEIAADVAFGTGLTIVTASATIILVAWR